MLPSLQWTGIKYVLNIKQGLKQRAELGALCQLVQVPHLLWIIPVGYKEERFPAVGTHLKMMKSTEITDWKSQIWCKSQFAEATKLQNLSQVDDSISVERIISVKGINRGYAKRLSPQHSSDRSRRWSCSRSPEESGSHPAVALVQPAGPRSPRLTPKQVCKRTGLRAGRKVLTLLL